MKNALKFITILLIGIIIGISITVYALRTQIKDDTYNKENNNNSIMEEVPLNELNEENELLWQNPSLSNGFEAQTINLDLNKYKGVVIVGKYDVENINNEKIIQSQYIDIGKTGELTIFYDTKSSNDITYRSVTVSNTGVQFGVGYSGNYLTIDNDKKNNKKAIPMYIIGVK